MLSSFKGYSGWALLVARLILAAVFIYHGQQKWAFFAGVPADMPAWLGITFQVLAVIEPLAGIALIIGLWTELAALVVAIIMVGAIVLKLTMFQVPFAGSQGTGWEFDLALLGLSLLVLTQGAGVLSVDKSMSPKKKK